MLLVSCPLTCVSKIRTFQTELVTPLHAAVSSSRAASPLVLLRGPCPRFPQPNHHKSCCCCPGEVAQICPPRPPTPPPHLSPPRHPLLASRSPFLHTAATCSFNNVDGCHPLLEAQWLPGLRIKTILLTIARPGWPGPAPALSVLLPPSCHAPTHPGHPHVPLAPAGISFRLGRVSLRYSLTSRLYH